MSWFAVDDRFWSHPKTLALREDSRGSAALALWVAAGSWCAAYAWQTGEVPGHVLASLGVVEWSLASDALVAVGLWERMAVSSHDANRVRFHDWEDWNGPNAQAQRMQRRLANDRERQRRRRGAPKDSSRS